MNRTTVCGLVGALVLVVVVGGCTAPEPDAREDVAETTSNLGEPTAAQASTQTATTPSAGTADSVAPNTIYIRRDDRAFAPSGRGGSIFVCAYGGRPALITRIRQLMAESGSTTHLVFEDYDGHWDTRAATRPRLVDQPICGPGETAYEFRLSSAEPDIGHVRNFDLSRAFSSGISFGNVSCSGGLSLARPFNLEVRAFGVEDGKLTRPQVTLSVAGQSTRAASGSCSVSASSGTRVIMVGIIPVVYQIEATFSLGIQVSRATSITASIGTNGGSLETDDPSFSLTPSVSLGVTFYGLVGGYVGVDMPITLRRQTGCTPEVAMSALLKAGVQAGLPGAGDLPISSSIGFEASGATLGPFTLRRARCN